jgi:aldehyde:ferredoxin oxidoreductase
LRVPIAISLETSCQREFKDAHGKIWESRALQGNDPDNFGAKLDLEDPQDILQAHALCNDLGLDVDVTSNVIAWAIACFQDGLLTCKETAGRKLTWGDARLVFDLIQAIAHREGLGDLLAEGCSRASQHLGRGSEKHCHHVRGNDLFECLWQSPAWAFGTVLSPRGGTHTRGAVLEERLQGLPAKLAMKWYGLSTIPEQGSNICVERLVIHQERLNAALDCLGLCSFTTSGRPDMLLPEDYADLAATATGKPIDETALLLFGERVHTQERCFNWLRGLPGREGDLPPRHFVDTPLTGRYRIDPAAWNRLLDRYYDQHGWNRETGWPTERTLASLELKVVTERLREAGHIVTPPKETR